MKCHGSCMEFLLWDKEIVHNLWTCRLPWVSVIDQLTFLALTGDLLYGLRELSSPLLLSSLS